MDILKRFLNKVNKTSSCWLWTGFCNEANYGRFSIKNRSVMAHRWIYEAVKGPIPKGLCLDHLCRTRNCVNPDHLEAVTQQENTRRGLAGRKTGLNNKRKTHCKYGHRYDKENTYIRKRRDGAVSRKCNICHRIREANRRNKTKGENNEF